MYHSSRHLLKEKKLIIQTKQTEYSNGYKYFRINLRNTKYMYKIGADAGKI